MAVKNMNGKLKIKRDPFLDYCKKDCYNFLSPYGLGDTLMLCGFRKEWEKKNGGKIHFIIKPSHEIVMKIYGINNYTCVKEIPGGWANPRLCDIAKQQGEPKIGHLYIAHPHFHKRYIDFLRKNDRVDSLKPFLAFYREFLGLDQEASLEFPHYEALDGTTICQKLNAYGKSENIILFLPEARTLTELPPSFWKNILHTLPKNAVVVQNTSDLSKSISGIPNIEMTLEELVWLCVHCRAVYALRSGMCDLIANGCKDLTVYYSMHPNLMQRYSLKSIFKKDIREVYIEVSNIKYYLFGFFPLLEICKSEEMNEIKVFGCLNFCLKKEVDIQKLYWNRFLILSYRKK